MSLFVPSCVEDFSRKWLLYVMQQYYANSYNGTTIGDIGEFSVQRLCRGTKEEADGDRSAEKDHSGDDDGDMEEKEVTAHPSQHILSQAYKVMVDVPDPPKEELEDGEKKVGSLASY